MRDDDLVVDVVLLVVGLVDGLVGQRLRLRVVGQPLEPPGLDAVPDLDDYVPDEPDEQHDAHDVQLLPGAQVGAVRVRHNEAGRFPQPVVAERRLLVAPEQRPVDAYDRNFHFKFRCRKTHSFIVIIVIIVFNRYGTMFTVSRRVKRYMIRGAPVAKHRESPL